ncbi:MAG: hypothetical protein IJE61_01545 [Bacteroidales bacterium]|nr:hypothetical protein [Bacteroidales bacterium]
MKKSTQILILALIAVLAASCATQQKLKTIREGQVQNVQLTLADDVSYLPEMKVENLQRDTLTIKDDDGTEILIMKAIKDEESGEMVATDVIEAAKVTARFRNVAERRGKIDLGFQIIVPESMIDSKWQLRFYPDMFIMEDSIRLEPVIITGEKYRNTQLKGYQQYERFLSKIISDTTIFVNVRALEIFIKRNIPEVYAFKTDSTIVSDEQFFSVYGVSEQEAVDHYTNKYAKNMNERRKARKDEMYRKYIKAPIVSEGLRLDSIITNPDGDFVYHYVQTIDTRPKLRKVDIVLSGEIYEQDVRLYTIPEVPPLTFYISSISAFADNTERYLTKVIERRASANTECKIAFELGKADIKLELADNLYEIQKIKTTLASLLNNETFDLDSILVSATASPEGSVATNRKLSNRRSESVSKYFNEFMSEYKDSLIIEGGVSMNMDGTEMEYTTKVQDIRFTPRSIPENWEDLYNMVQVNPDLTEEAIFAFNKIYEAHEDLDKRERVLSQEPYYRYLRDSLYPRLRTVKFNFFLHRKGMVKDTVHTTVLDSTYMNGVQALREMDYNTAVALLRPYNDYNTAVAYMGMDRNLSALQILEDMERTPQVNYLLAVLYSRTGDPQKAVQCYMNACNADRSYVYRGNLDPEISVLIKTYGLNQEPEEEYDF